MSSERPPFECPVCGESVPRNAKACPECGACEKSGWSADAAYDELPDVDFDYDSPLGPDPLFFDCPRCGESVPREAKACPECGAGKKSEWGSDIGSVRLPDEDFDYDRFIADEFGGARETTRKEKLWWLAAVVVVIALGWVVIFRAAFL